jgi:hypothetical protein
MKGRRESDMHPESRVLYNFSILPLFSHSIIPVLVVQHAISLATAAAAAAAVVVTVAKVHQSTAHKHTDRGNINLMKERKPFSRLSVCRIT